MIRVCTIGRLGAKCAVVGKMSFPVWTGKVYEIRKRVRDGKPYLRLVETFGGTMADNKPSKRFVLHIRETSQFPFVPNVSARTKPETLPLSALVQQ